MTSTTLRDHLAHLTGLLGDLLDLVAPRRCAACGCAHEDPFPLCPPCADALAPAEDPPPGVSVPYALGGPLADAIRRAKYGGDPAVAAALGALLVPSLAALAGTSEGAVDLVVAVPLHPKRLAGRGFNQSVELARAVARALRAPLAFGVVVRTRDTPSQTSLDRGARATNVRGAFGVRDARGMAGARVLVIDDVVTTGATLGAVEAALTAAGARTVHALALARTPLG